MASPTAQEFSPCFAAGLPVEWALAVKQAEEAGIDRDLEREGRFVDPATGEPVDVGRKSATAFDSGFGGWGRSDPLGEVLAYLDLAGR